jgi:hypothetical protein
MIHPQILYFHICIFGTLSESGFLALNIEHVGFISCQRVFLAKMIGSKTTYAIWRSFVAANIKHALLCYFVVTRTI